MHKAGIAAVLVTFGMAAQAELPPEPFELRINTVDVAGREIVASGVTWALSSTAAIHMPGRNRVSLGDLKPGMNVRLQLEEADAPVPVVRTITVLPD